MAGPIRQSVDIPALERYIDSNVPEIKTPLEVLQFGYGQSNPTYLLTSAVDKKRFVLRKKPPGQLLSKTAHAVEREYRVMKALEGEDVPAPKVYCLCTDTNVIGTAFYLMEFLDGRIFANPSIPGVSPADRRQMYNPESRWHSAITTLAKLHTTPLVSRPDAARNYDLTSFGRPTNFYPRQIKTLGTISYSQSLAKDVDTGVAVGPLPHFKALLEYFENSLVEDRGCIIHGDYKIDNLIFHPTLPKVIGILDWELSTIGHPLSDVSNLTMPWVTAREQLDYGTVGPEDEDMKRRKRERDEFLPGRTEGLPTREEILKWYSEVAGWDPRQMGDYGDGFMLFRTAVIAQGVAARYALRQASSAKAQEYGRQFPMYAETAWNVVSRKHTGIAKL
ncbi:kinase-like domain-containing protein [Kalaharituber pfeilii]|nr:kinase-like domain-containing protein [Kalaharituber pfeilii]